MALLDWSGRKARRATVNVAPVSVNGRLARLRHDDLYDYTEQCLMHAGWHLSQYRQNGDKAHLDQAKQQAEWGVEGLVALDQT